MLPCLLVRTYRLRFLARGNVQLTCDLRTIANGNSRAACSRSKAKRQLAMGRLMQRSGLCATYACFILRRLTRQLRRFGLRVLKRATCIIVELRRLNYFYTALCGVKVSNALSRRISAIRLTNFFLGSASGLSTSGLTLFFQIDRIFRLKRRAIYDVRMCRIDFRLLTGSFRRNFQFTLARRSIIRICTGRLISSNFRRRDNRRKTVRAAKRYRRRLAITRLAACRLRLIISRVHRIPIHLDLTDVRCREFRDLLSNFRVVHGLQRLRFTRHLIISNDRCKRSHFMGLKRRISKRPIGRVIKTTISSSTFRVQRNLRFNNDGIIQMSFTVCSRHAGHPNGRYILVTSRVRGRGRVLLRSSVLFLDWWFR